MSREPNARPHRLLLVFGIGTLLLATAGLLAFLELDRERGEEPTGEGIDWSNEPNPFADGFGDREAFRALMREIDHHFLAIQNETDALTPPVPSRAFQSLLEHARALQSIVERPQFRYAEAPSDGLFEERREDLRSATAQLYAALAAEDVPSVREARSQIAQSCDRCHGTVRLQSDVKPLMRYMEGLLTRSQTLLLELERDPRPALYDRFQELGNELATLSSAGVLRDYRRDDTYREHREALEAAAHGLRVAAERQDRTEVEVQLLRLTLGGCEACHRQLVR